MRKGSLEEGWVNGFAIFILITILLIVYLVVDYDLVPDENIRERIYASEGVSDTGLALINLMNTKVGEYNIYEYILMNKDDNGKIKEAINKEAEYFCRKAKADSFKEKASEEFFDELKYNACFYKLLIKFEDGKEIEIGNEIEASMYHYEDSLNSSGMSLDVDFYIGLGELIPDV